MTCTISIILYVTFYAPDVFRKGDALMNATTSSSPQARLGLDFLRWPEMGCSWTFLNPLLWPSREYLLDCDSLQTPEKTSPSSVQTGHNNTIIMRHITLLLTLLLRPDLTQTPLSPSHLCLFLTVKWQLSVESCSIPKAWNSGAQWHRHSTGLTV